MKASLAAGGARFFALLGIAFTARLPVRKQPDLIESFLIAEWEFF